VCVHHCAPTGNVLIRRLLLEKFGPFCTAPYGSDIALSKKLAASGHPPVYAQEAAVVHQCDLTNCEYLARTYWNSRGNAVHAPGTATAAELVRQLARLPWRPGFRSGPEVRSAAVDRAQSPYVRTWLYMWMARIAGYAGRIAGTAARRRGADDGRRPAAPKATAREACSPTGRVREGA